MILPDNFPEEWKTNKNLRYWLSLKNNDEYILSSDEDKFIHEAVVVEFAKQFHQKEIDRLKDINKTLTEDLDVKERLNEIYRKKLGE